MRSLYGTALRMVRNPQDAQDLVQETFLRAWQKRDSWQGRASFRAWLYRIATNACLDFLARHERRVVELSALAPSGEELSIPHVDWLQPFPDRLLGTTTGDGGADALVIRRETIELGFLVALQCLPPRQRAVLILRDVLEWSTEEAAGLLESSVASVNSALQRARGALRRRQPRRDEAVAPAGLSDAEMALVRQYVDATERFDTEALTRLLRDDARFSMPPSPFVSVGGRATVQAWVKGGFGKPPYDDLRFVVTSANRMPAVANYLRKPGEAHHRAFMIDVLRIEGGRVAEVTSFDLPPFIDAFGLPAVLAEQSS